MIINGKKVRYHKVRLNSGGYEYGKYGIGGKYYGSHSPGNILYRANLSELEPYEKDDTFEFRAANRTEAAELLKARYSGIKFYM